MSGPTRKVVQISDYQGSDEAQVDYRREVGKGAEIVPVNFRRAPELERLRDTPISFYYVPSERQEGLYEMIINVPDWMANLLMGVGINPIKPYDPPTDGPRGDAI